MKIGGKAEVIPPLDSNVPLKEWFVLYKHALFPSKGLLQKRAGKPQIDSLKRIGNKIYYGNWGGLSLGSLIIPAQREVIAVDDSVKQLANSLVLKDIRLPVELNSEQQPLFFQLYNQELTQRLQQRKLLLPNFDKTGAVCIFSDYGGESSDSRYLTYTFTFVDYDFLGLNYEKKIKEIRETYGLQSPYKEIAFKDLNYGPLQRALPAYLEMLDQSVNGLVFTLLVDKTVVSLLGENKKQTLSLAAQQMSELELGQWKPKTVEKLQRVLQHSPILLICWFLLGKRYSG